jgi:membrane protein involved in colicin uptake
MGGKGGGAPDNSAYIAQVQRQQDAIKAEKDKEIADQAAAAKSASDAITNEQKAAQKAAADQAAAEKAASDKTASDKAAADKALADQVAHTPLGYPIQSGGAITTPSSSGNAPGSDTLGGALGGSIISPPDYWVGSGSSSAGNTGRSAGAIKTVQ